MDVFIARQPIFDINKEVYAYKLLYRDSKVNNSEVDDIKVVLANCFMEIGYETITNGKKAFINCTKELINIVSPTTFPSDIIVIDIPKGVEPTPEMVQKCIQLKAKEYIIALDDFEYKKLDKYKKLLRYVDVLKVDWILNSKEDKQGLISEVRKINPNIKFLAEKIETDKDYQEAVKSGFDLFQGYFFSKPTIIKKTGSQTSKMNYAQILNELSKPNPEFESITQVITKDPVLAMQLLKLINSVAFRSMQQVTSIHNAVVRLGLKEIKKWVSVLMLRETTKEKPDEIMRLSLIRAYFMEHLAELTDLKKRKSEAFIFGLFSMIDVLFNYPKEELLKDVPLNKDVKAALLGEENEFTNLYTILICYEKANWEKLDKHIKDKEIKINSSKLAGFYYESLKLAEELMES